MAEEKYYNLDSLKDMLDDDPEAQLQMIRIFLESTPGALADLNEHYKKKDYPMVGRLAHKIKSSIDIFNINELKQDVRTIEKYGKEQTNLDELDALIPKLNNIMEVAIRQIKEEETNLTRKIQK